MRLFLRRFPSRQLPVSFLFALPGVAMIGITTANSATLTVTGMKLPSRYLA